MTPQRRKVSHSVIFAIIAVLVVGGALWGWQVRQPDVPEASPSPAGQSASLPPEAGAPLETAPGFTATLLTDRVPGARDLAMDPSGNLWVSQTKQGTVSLVRLANLKPGEQPEVRTVLSGLNRPHGIAFDWQEPGWVYIATEREIFRLPADAEGALERVAALPAGGRHFTRSLMVAPDGRLYVSIGSTCDVCEEQDSEVATVISMKTDGSDRRTEATGLRNAVFMETDPVDGRMWVTEMGRDWLGDNLPPDELNIISRGKDYGWPECYGQNVPDLVFKRTASCAGKEPAWYDLPAHVAPLGLAFVPEEGWPDGWGLDLLVSQHGSWNRSEPAGYRVVAYDVDQRTRKVVGSRDFLWGFRDGEEGRPVDVLALPGGTAYISDDKSGSIWKVRVR